MFNTKTEAKIEIHFSSEEYGFAILFRLDQILLASVRMVGGRIQDEVSYYGATSGQKLLVNALIQALRSLE